MKYIVKTEYISDPIEANNEEEAKYKYFEIIENDDIQSFTTFVIDNTSVADDKKILTAILNTKNRLFAFFGLK